MIALKREPRVHSGRAKKDGQLRFFELLNNDLLLKYGIYLRFNIPKIHSVKDLGCKKCVAKAT